MKTYISVQIKKKKKNLALKIFCKKALGGKKSCFAHRRSESKYEWSTVYIIIEHTVFMNYDLPLSACIYC